MNFIKENIRIWLIASLTLGLAPFSPPHIWSKLVLMLNGQASGFNSADWFDVFIHGTPWVLLMLSIVLKLTNNIKR